MDERLERNKQMVMAFYDLMFNQSGPRGPEGNRKKDASPALPPGPLR